MHPYFAWSRTLASVAAVFVVLAASSAHAQEALVINASGPECQSLEQCKIPGTRCDGALGGTCETIALVDGSTKKICVDRSTIVFCCEGPGAGDCPQPSAGMTEPTCVGPRDGTFGRGLCSYSDWDACLTAATGTDAELIEACFQPPAGGTPPLPPGLYGTVPLAGGDCDRDGIENGDEPGCVCDRAPECASVDGGMSGTDAGADLDAGANTQDAGELPPFDSGSADIDANLPPGAGLDFRGAGGCACEAGGARASGPSGSAALLLTLGGFLALCARRRSSRAHAKADPRR